ncbi:MAG: proton-conducting transporter membrane subunit, partial [Actinomycetota bacterium]|nr:proton-conducting transporter membrane subunit [Actinomycetota bacterium]
PAGLLTLEMGRKNLIAVFWCFIAGFGVKAALVPLHGWVPDAHPAAPAPFSAVLSGVMVAAGSFGIMRVVYSVFGVALLRELDVMRWLAYIAGFTVVFAALLAVNQENLKRRLAYSTISQMGYAALGVALLTEQATTGALVHITNHAFMKGALFLCAGLLIKRAGIRNVRDISGIAQKMPITSAAFAIAALSMIGTPPLSGFVSKWYLGLGMLDADQPLYLAVLLGGALLAAVYLLPIVYAAYFKPPSAAVLALPERSGLEAPLTMLVPLVAAIVLTIALGLVSSVQGMPLSLARLAAAIAFK